MTAENPKENREKNVMNEAELRELLDNLNLKRLSGDKSRYEKAEFIYSEKGKTYLVKYKSEQVNKHSEIIGGLSVRDQVTGDIVKVSWGIADGTVIQGSINMDFIPHEGEEKNILMIRPRIMGDLADIKGDFAEFKKFTDKYINEVERNFVKEDATLKRQLDTF